MKLTATLVKRAWEIRRESALKWDCKIMVISWKECLVMASEIQDVFVEIILSDKDQKELSKDLFKDENYSDSDCLDNVKEFKSSNTCTGCHYFLSGSCALENSSDDFVDGACEDYETLKTLKGNSAKELYLNRDMSDFEMDMYM